MDNLRKYTKSIKVKIREIKRKANRKPTASRPRPSPEYLFSPDQHLSTSGFGTSADKWHRSGKCLSLAFVEHRRRKNTRANMMNWPPICAGACVGKYKLEVDDKWYHQRPDEVIEDGQVMILWDFSF